MSDVDLLDSHECAECVENEAALYCLHEHPTRAAIRLEMLREARKRVIEEIPSDGGTKAWLKRWFNNVIAEEEAKS